MPELPEVEVIVKGLQEQNLTKFPIVKAEIFWPRIVSEPSCSIFLKKLQNQKIEKIYRRGKFLVFQLCSEILLLHLRMTGKLIVNKSKDRTHKSEHLRIYFSDGRILHYEDQRKFGRWSLIQNEIQKFENLGIEPLSKEFTANCLFELLNAHKMQIKPFLLNQKFIAGLGNIYTDEALWKAKIHPLCLTNSITHKQASDLVKAIKLTLEQGIANQGTSLGIHRSNYVSLSGTQGENQNSLAVYGQEGKPCPRCGSTIIKIRVAQRGTHLCPNCQKHS